MNPEVVDILISIDKSVDNVLKKYSIDHLPLSSPKENHPKLAQTLKPIQFIKSPSVGSIQQDRRDRRTLRAKVNQILNSLPEVCKILSKKELKLMQNEKKKKLELVNQIREKLSKDPLYPDDISLDSSFDVYGNLKLKFKDLSVPLTPRSALRTKLTAKELEMLKEDPVYFIQNEKYKYKIKLDEDENWEKLLDNESPKKMKNSEKKVEGFETERKKIERAGEVMLKKPGKYEIKGLEKIAKKNFRVKSVSEKQFKEMLSPNFYHEEIKVRNVNPGGDKKTNIQNYYVRMEQIQKMQQKERDIEEKILKFEKEAKKAEESYLNRLRKQALKERFGLRKDKTSPVSRQAPESRAVEMNPNAYVKKFK